MKTHHFAFAVLIGIWMHSHCLAQGSYDSCSVRVKTGWWGSTLVAGAEERKLSTPGFFPSEEPAGYFSQRSELAASFY